MTSLIKAREVLRLKRLAKEKELEEEEERKKSLQKPIEAPPVPILKEKEEVKQQEETKPVEVEMQEEEAFFKQKDTIPTEPTPPKKISLMDLFLIPPKMDSIVSTPIVPQRVKRQNFSTSFKETRRAQKRKRESSSEDESQSSEEETESTKQRIHTPTIPPSGHQSPKNISSSPKLPPSSTLSSIQATVGGLVKQMPPGVIDVLHAAGVNLSWAGGVVLLVILRGVAQNILQSQSRRVFPPSNNGQIYPSPPSSNAVVPPYVPVPSGENFNAFTK